MALLGEGGQQIQNKSEPCCLLGIGRCESVQRAGRWHPNYTKTKTRL